jgi:hypothetical protein
LEEKVTEDWLCWQDEPGANILYLLKFGEQLSLEVYETEISDLAHRGISLNEYMIKRVYKATGSLRKIAEAVYLEFELYEYGIGRKRYEKNWGVFPMQYYRLRKLLRE